MKQKFNQNYRVRIMCIIALMVLFISYSFGQIGFDNITFKIPNTTATLEAVEIGDVNNDGLNDMVIVANMDFGTSEHYVYIYKQLSEGGFSEPIKLPYPETYVYVSDIEIADLNNDGLNDIAILYDFNGTVGIFYQQVDGSFSDIQEYTGIGNWYSGIRCGDLNNDGLIDIAGYNWPDKSYRILYQKPEGGFSLHTIPTTTDDAFRSPIEIGDLNGDGLNDIVLAGGYQIEILFQNADFSINTDNAIILTLPDLSLKVTIGDVNNDGKNDIIVTFGGSAGYYVIIYYQTDNGVFSESNSKIIKAYQVPEPIFVIDFNCDGDNEIVVGHSGWQAITTYEKSITGEYDSYVKYPSLYFSSPFSMAVGDINNDSRPDVVAVGQNGKINILYNTSKPLTFDEIDIEIENLIIQTDTTTYTYTIYEPIIDPDSDSPQNNFYKLEITDTFEYKFYRGDSIIIRHGFLCSEYIDTLKIPFHYVEHNLIESDTIKSITNNITDIAVNPDFYVNSTTKKLIITRNDLSETTKVRLYDLSGRIVLIENPRNAPTEIDLSSLMKGVYVLILESSDRRVKHKILIQ